eukprot:118483_1
MSTLNVFTKLSNTKLCSIILASLFLIYINLLYEIVDFHMDILNNVSPTTNTLFSPTNIHIKKFATEAAFCNLTSPFATIIENKLKERIYTTILKNQFPTNCDPNNYWISSMKWQSGLGWKMHQLALSLLTAISKNKIFIWGNNYKKWPFIQSPYCKTMECYFEPVTNCSLPADQTLKFHPRVILTVTKSMQTFWNPILGIDHEPQHEFYARSSDKYTILVTIAQWYLLRYNSRTQRIVANNIERTLNLMGLKPDEKPNPNEMISIPVRHSDKCYNKDYNNAGAEMLCFDAKHIITIATQIQFMYKHKGDNIKYGIVNSEDSNVVEQIINSSHRTFHILTNVNDIRPETGDPKVWDTDENVIGKSGMENDYMTSMLTVAQLSTIPRYWLYMFSSNWFFYLSHFRSVLKCYPSNLNKNGDVQIELMTYCKRCGSRGSPGVRHVIYRGVDINVYEDKFLDDMLSLQCVGWTIKVFEDRDRNKYEVHCQLTDEF